jgi:diguanylate cyclase (GGDEF)-like protein
VPLEDPDGSPLGVIWADEPEDRLVPRRERLQALRLFANQATTALALAGQVEELRFLADHDPLTRLLNRRAFIARLDAEVARSTRSGKPFGLVLCDLDGFKALNDRDGHLAGDEALRVVARLLGETVRRSDDVFRIGGDEFALLLPEASAAAAAEIVARVGRALEESAEPAPADLRASLGVASFPEQATTSEALFRVADESLYAAKRTRAAAL